jgi:putative transcriptional regulator
VTTRNTLAQRRTAAGMVQEELARRVGVSRQTIIALEQGRYEPRLSLAFRLAAVFGCTIEDLFSPPD